MSRNTLTALLTALLLCLPPCAAQAAHSARKAHRAAVRAPVSIPVVTGAPRDAAATARDFNAWLDAAAASGQVSGLAAAVVKGDKVLLQRGIGYADASRSLPVTPDTVFRLAYLPSSLTGSELADRRLTSR